MRLLLDTHAFLWFIKGSDKLSSYARRIIEDESNDRYLSAGSLWEIAIKVSIGKLEVPLPITRLVTEHVEANGIDVLGIKPGHLDEQRNLPFHHNDPFDRMIIAQAIVEEMKVIGKDEAFELYPIDGIWRKGK
jgi:PIN domain nuclease of toxin-antitoxin system